MGKYTQDAKKLLEKVGGKENISAVTHCATRIRFVLHDPKKADEKKISEITSVKGMFTNAGQFQVIIGNDVSTFYKDFSYVSGIDGMSKEQVKAVAKQNQPFIQRMITGLAEIFTPLLPAIIVGGLILGFRNILEAVPMGFLNGQTLVEVYPFWNGVNSFLWLPGEAIFHFLPVGITWSVARKMGATEILGIILGITLVSPQLLNAYAVNGTTAAEIAKDWAWNFGFFSIDKIGYQAQVIPAMLAGFLLVYLERFFRKHMPEAISMIFVPLFSLLPTIIAAHTILGPFGWKVGTLISTVVNAGLTSSFSWLFGGVFGALYAPLVITGLHHTTLAIDTQLIADFGSTNLWPMICLSNIAQGAAVASIAFLHRGNKKEEQISIPATISAWLGVTEPAMFGINLKYMYPFVAAMIGSGLAGLLVTLFKVRALSIGVGGLPGILAIRPQDYAIFTIGMLIAIVVPFVCTLLFQKMAFFKKEEAVISEVSDETGDLEISIPTPIKGEIFSLEQAHDPAFAKGTLGSGVVIEPAEGKVFAPFDGQVKLLFPTLHAIGLVSDSGLEMLIHIGLDTVKLDGKHFVSHIQQGDRVTAGQLLLEFDLKAIHAAGYETQTPIVITNATDFKVDPILDQKEVNVSQLILSASKL